MRFPSVLNVVEHSTTGLSLFAVAGTAASHLLLHQACNVLLAVVAALALDNAAGGPSTRPAAMVQLLRAQELQAQLDKGKWPCVAS